ncbi:MAG: ThuA domain-containing protein, partial [Candidatus Dormibacteraeota bacterium]|nr:ThuA domain-containing protein [Candidatus Dormibacteraeota bacterium]
MTTPVRVTIWNENVHEQRDEPVRKIYPQGMHTVIARGLRERLGERVEVRCATLAEREHGLTEEVLEQTDVLTWWGHAAHGAVEDQVVDRVVRHVLEGMGLVVLHSAHMSRVFRRLMGTP